MKIHSREWWTLVKHMMKKRLGLEYIKTIGEKWANDVNQKLTEEPQEAHKHMKLILNLTGIEKWKFNNNHILYHTH